MALLDITKKLFKDSLEVFDLSYFILKEIKKVTLAELYDLNWCIT